MSILFAHVIITSTAWASFCFLCFFMYMYVETQFSTKK